MATGSFPLSVGSAINPDGTTSNAAPATTRVKSSATAPAPYFLQLAFDAATREQITFQKFRMPADFASGPILKIQFKMASAVTGNVVMEARVAAITPGDATNADAKAFDAANTSATTAVPATTAGKVAEISITLTNNDSLAAGDEVSIYLARDAANAADTAAGDLYVTTSSLIYTTV